MRKGPSRGDARALVWMATLVFGLAMTSCQEGRPPYEVIEQEGDPQEYLPPPPEGVVPGTEHTLGLLYHFDRSRYRTYRTIPGTAPRFVRGDSVLSVQQATLAQLLRPDSDPTLARVYDDPRLFRFVGVAPDDPRVGQFLQGPILPNTHEFFPLQAGNWWKYNHNQNEWTIADSITGTTDARTAMGMPVYSLVSTSTARSDFFNKFKPSPFQYEIRMSSVPGRGLFFHGWTLVSERLVHPDDRDCRTCEPIEQRNPRFLWLSIGSLGIPDPQAPIPDTPDQCLDELPGFLDLFPIQVAGENLQVGDIYTTWTYIRVSDEDVRARLASEAQQPRGGRCGLVIPTENGDTLRIFPTQKFSLLARFEARVVRALDRLELKLPNGTTLGNYPGDDLEPDGTLDVVQIDVTMSLRNSGLDVPAQFIRFFYMRGIGEVQRLSGIERSRRSQSRLRTCMVDGVLYPPADFDYRD